MDANEGSGGIGYAVCITGYNKYSKDKQQTLSNQISWFKGLPVTHRKHITSMLSPTA
jgi:hypothetical protein